MGGELMRRNLILIFLLSLVCLSLSYAGGISSSGGDNPPFQENSAWFLGTRPIQYCIDVAPGLGKTISFWALVEI